MQIFVVVFVVVLTFNKIPQQFSVLPDNVINILLRLCYYIYRCCCCLQNIPSFFIVKKCNKFLLFSFSFFNFSILYLSAIAFFINSVFFKINIMYFLVLIISPQIVEQKILIFFNFLIFYMCAVSTVYIYALQNIGPLDFFCHCKFACLKTILRRN